MERARGPAAAGEPEARLLGGEDAPAVRPADVHHLGPLRELRGEHVLRPAARGRGADGAQADELPGPHAPLRLRAPLVPRPADPLRGVLDAPPRRARRDAPRAPARQAHHAGRRPRLRHGGPDPGRDRPHDRLRPLPLRPLRGDASRGALHTAGEAPRHGRAMGSRRGRARAGAPAARHGVRGLSGRGHFLRAEDRPAHDRRRSAGAGRWGRSSSTTRCR